MAVIASYKVGEMMPTTSTGNGPSRRDLLKFGGGAALAGTVLPSCDLSTDPAAGADEAGGGPKGMEAPQLAQRVRDGELPPLADRLPESPLVVEPTQDEGVYGGEWATALSVEQGAAFGFDGTGYVMTYIGYEPLVRWDTDWNEVVPNIAESFNVNNDGTEYVFHLRRGIRWSDGEPFTADDIAFAYDEIMNNDELSPAGPPSFFVTANGPGELEVVDEHTVRFVFPAPNGLFLQNLASPSGIQLVIRPRHYLTQFHSDHNPDADQLASEHNFDDWIGLFSVKGDTWENIELPTLRGWVVTAAAGEGTRLVAERNPFYWKTDPSGAQLPYIDRVVFTRFNSVDVLLLSIVNGEIDLHALEFNTLQNKPIVARESETAGYRVYDMVPATMNSMMLALNLTHQDQTLREVFTNLDFRIGLSHAINRQEIIESVYQRQGEPWQGAPRSETEFYDEELAKQYTEYDVDLANQRLDRVLPERDDEGFRLKPDGARLSISVEVPGETWVEHVDALELVRSYWQDVGVASDITNESRTLFEERRAANLHDAVTWHGNGGLDVIMDPKWYLPFNIESAYAVPWASWRISGGAEGEEPPQHVLDQLDLYDQINYTPDVQEQAALMTQVLETSKEQFYVMGITLSHHLYGIVKNNFHNVPETMPRGWLWPTPGPTNPEQYYIEEE